MAGAPVSIFAAISSLLLMGEVAQPIAITSTQAIAIAAAGACGMSNSAPEIWSARLEGRFWRVWTPADTDPDSLSNFVFEQVYVDAETGKVDHCVVRTE